MEITQEELLGTVQDLATENAILRRRNRVLGEQVQELTNALNQRVLDEAQPGEAVRVPLNADGEQVGPAELVPAPPRRPSETELRMHALSPDRGVRERALCELLGRAPTADELEHPEHTLELSEQG